MAIDPQWIMAGSEVLGAAVGRPAGSAYSSASSYHTFDSSGWTVALGGSSATGAPRTQTDLGQLSPLLVAAALLAFIVWKKKSS
ncbi:MAG TPA: hypothetical protein VED01_07785 [Burkholderiales bacterium]|nr:hypothetical protein [Burkholderiales bacterium]